jgi:uncharacterized protein with FMN-binding domain
MRRLIISIVTILIVLIISFVIFVNVQTNKLASGIDMEYKKITSIDFNNIPDGIYKGSYMNLPVGIDLEVIIKDHKISGIKIISQYNGPKHEGRKTIDDIINQQKNIVDTVSGSTYSSKAIMIAVNRAIVNK